MFETMLCNKQLNYIGKSLNTPNDRSNDTTSKFLYKTSIVIPSLVQSVLIGNKGANIKKLQNEFGVKMRLIGDNWLDYPNGRTLQILGDSEGKIIKARKFIDEEYILKKWEAMNIGQRFFTEAVDEQNIVYKEVVVPKVLTTRGEEDMAKMQKSSGIIEYLYRDSKQNGMRIIILRGTKDAVSKAEMELKRLSENIPKKANSVSSFGETETIIDVQKPFVIPQQTPFNTFSKKLSQKTTNLNQPKNIQHSLNQKLLAYSPPPLQNPNLTKLRINKTKNANNISVSAFSQSSMQPVKHFISGVEYQTNIKNEFLVDSGIDSPTEIPHNLQNEYIHRSCKLNNLKSCSITSEEKYESEIRELRSENEKLKRQVELKDRELVRLNGVRACFGCNSAQRSIIFLPCAHFLLCIKCSEHNEVCLICNLPRVKKLVKYG